MAYNYRHRDLSSRISSLFEHFPCVIVIGARQVGKSTLLTHLFPEANHILLDPVQDVNNIRRDPDLFLHNTSFPVIFDEVQYAPELIPALKRFIDKNKRREIAEEREVRAGASRLGGDRLLGEADAARERLEPGDLLRGRVVALADAPRLDRVGRRRAGGADRWCEHRAEERGERHEPHARRRTAVRARRQRDSGPPEGAAASAVTDSHGGRGLPRAAPAR